MKDAALTRLFLRFRDRGDGRALAAIFDSIARELLAVAAHVVGTEAEAEDLVQLVFLRAIERAPSFDPERGLRGWLYGILWREGAKLRRRAARRPRPDRTSVAVGADPAEEVAGLEVPGVVVDALARLAGRYREVLEPLLLEEKPPHAIAAELGRAPGTVRVQIHRGMEELRRRLPHGFGASGVFGALVLPRARGLRAVRSHVLTEAGVAAATVGRVAVAAQLLQASAAASLPAWTGTLAVGTAAVAVAPTLLRSAGILAEAPSSEPHSDPTPTARAVPTDEPSNAMKLPLPLLPVVLSLSSVSAAQQAGAAREPVLVESRAESVAKRVARLDALVEELLATALGEGDDAAAAEKGLRAAGRRIEQAFREREAARSREMAAALGELEGWVEAVSQVADPVRRDAALREISLALQSGDEGRRIAACRALAALGEVQFDKAPFRDAVLAAARDLNGEGRAAALYALWSVSDGAPEHRGPGRALAIELAADVETAPSRASHLIAQYSGGKIEGEATTALLALLADPDRRRMRSTLSGIWGVHVPTEVVDRLLELSRSQEGELAYDTMYYALSTLPSKSPAVIERLAEFLESPDPNRYGRASWGLGYGVAAEDAHLVAAAARRWFEARSSARIQTDALELVAQYGRPEDVAWLEAIRDDPARPDAVRRQAGDAVRRISGR